MDQSPAPKRHFRLFIIYRTVIRILLSFGWVQFLGYFRGEEWTKRRMTVAYIKNAGRLKNTILKLKGLFVKVGQLISIMSNFLPESFRDQLEGLQDKIPPRSFEEISSRIQSELGDSPDNLFATFNQSPIASASLAQVHAATLVDGTKVAVKIQYPEIEKLARQDLNTIKRILGLVGFIFSIKGLDTNFQQVQEMILDELDFRKEAEYIDTIAGNFTNDPKIKFPRVVHARSTQRVLTTHFMDGTKVTNLDYLKENDIQADDLADRIIKAYCQMIFVDGIYHADPHPGNILIQPAGEIVFLDFGAVAKLSPAMKEGMALFFEGILKRDKDQVTDAMRVMGFFASTDNSQEVETIIDYFYTQFLQQLSFDSWNLNDIEVDLQTKLDVMKDFKDLNISISEVMGKVQVPKDWILLERTILMLMGLCTHLHPEMNPMKTIGPYLKDFVLGEDGEWKNIVGSFVKEVVSSVIKIPAQINSIMVKADSGNLTFKVKHFTESADMLYALGHQFIYVFLGVSAGGMSYFSYLQNNIDHMNAFGGLAAFFSLTLLGSMWRVRQNRKKRR